MPPELDDDRIAAIREFLCDGRVEFSSRSILGQKYKEIHDIGLNGLFGSKLTQVEKQRRLLTALIEFLDAGLRPNRVEPPYGVVYEFRFTYVHKNLYIKTHWPPPDAANPVLEVLSVKLQD